MAELKECPLPWCRGAARIAPMNGAYYWGQCVKCGLQSRPVSTRVMAARAWNHRPAEEALEAENTRLTAQIDAFWFAVWSQWHIEPREYFEAEIAKGIGFSNSPLAMAVHHMTKRDRRLPEGVQRVIDAADAAVMIWLYENGKIGDEMTRLHASLIAFKSSEDEAVDAPIAAEERL